MTNQTNYNKLAKTYDKNGKWAILGMDGFVARYFNLKPYSCSGSEINSSEAIEYITETYLECIESISFEDWIIKGNNDGKVLIISEYHFKEMYSEIFEINQSIQDAINDIAILYDCEWLLFAKGEYESNYLVTTTYKPNYNKLDIVEIHKAMSVFRTLLDLNKITSAKRTKFIKDINKSANNFFKNYNINEMSNFDLIQEVSLKLGLGYV